MQTVYMYIMSQNCRFHIGSHNCVMYMGKNVYLLTDIGQRYVVRITEGRYEHLVTKLNVNVGRKKKRSESIGA